MNTETRNKTIQTLLGSSAAINSGEDKVFQLLQLALCAHMTVEQQDKFLADATGRMLITDNGIVRDSFEDHLVLQLMRTYPHARVDVRAHADETISIGGILHLDGDYSIRTALDNTTGILTVKLHNGGIDDVVGLLGQVIVDHTIHFNIAIRQILENITAYLGE